MAKSQQFLPYDCSTLANYKSWIQGIHNAMNTLGWALAGDSGQLVIGNLAAVPASISTYSLLITQLDTWIGAWVNTGTAYALGNIVTNGGLTYKCAFATALRTLTGVTSSAGTTTYSSVTSGDIHAGDTVLVSNFVTSGNNGTFTVATVTGAWGSVTQFTCVTTTQSGTETGVAAARVINVTPPASDLTTASSANSHWYPDNYEIWVSQGSASTNNPIYLKFIYGVGAGTVPEIVIWIATSQTNGVLGGNVFNNNAGFAICTGTGTAQGSSGIECDFCGSNDDVSILLYRTYAPGDCFLVIDRAKDINGNDLDSYFTILACTAAVGAGGGNSKYQVIFKPGTGGLFPTGSASINIPFPNISSTTNSVNGMTLAAPVFPLVGYVGNPILGAVIIGVNDLNEGSLVNVVMYGTSHTFLFSKPAGMVNSTDYGIAIRWE